MARDTTYEVVLRITLDNNEQSDPSYWDFAGELDPNDEMEVKVVSVLEVKDD